MSLLPQFVSDGSESFLALAVLGVAFSLLGLAWLTLYAVVVAKAGQFLRGRVRRALDAVTGTRARRLRHPARDGAVAVLESLVAFVAVSAVVICTPGQDTALTIRNTLAGGRPSGIATAAGVSLGQAVWTVAASAGVVALLTASEPVFRTLKLVGAAYLVYLGVQSLWAAIGATDARAQATVCCKV